MTRILLFFSFIVLYSCSSDKAYRYYGKKTYKMKAVDKVAVLYDEPASKYEAIADFQAIGSTSMIDTFQEKAAEIGADAVIITVSNESYDRANEWAGQGINKIDSKEYFLNHFVYGTAVVFDDITDIEATNE